MPNLHFLKNAFESFQKINTLKECMLPKCNIRKYMLPKYNILIFLLCMKFIVSSDLTEIYSYP